jgi:signal transduction histidine kinase
MKSLLRGMRRSLFLRLVLIFLLAAVAASLLIAGGLRLLYHDEVQQGPERYVTHYLSYLLADLGTPPDPRRASEIARQLPLDIRLAGPGLTWTSHPDFPLISTLGEPSRRHNDILVYHSGYRHILCITQGDYQVYLALPGFSQERHPKVALLVILVFIFILIGTYLAVRWLFRPLKWISEGTARIGQGELTYRLPEHREDELGSIIRDINAMAQDLERRLEAKRELLLAVSHELRTPLTRAKLALEFLPENSRQRRLIKEELDEISQLVEELLETERLSERHLKLDLQEVDLNELVHKLISEHFGSDENRLQVRLPDDACSIFADAPRLRLLLRNLIHNALQHSDSSNPVEVCVQFAEDRYRIIVTDHGSGIAEEHLPYLTEPFYRADPARQRKTGGFGLGLYLCRLVAQAHDGSLTIKSAPDQGTTVTAYLAIKPNES